MSRAEMEQAEREQRQRRHAGGNSSHVDCADSAESASARPGLIASNASLTPAVVGAARYPHSCHAAPRSANRNCLLEIMSVLMKYRKRRLAATTTNTMHSYLRYN